MLFELNAKAQVNSILSNDLIVGLIRDKKYVFPNKGGWIELEGSLNFSLSWENDRLVLTINNVKPRVTAKVLLLKVQGRLNKIKIGKEDILLEIDDLPDPVVKLT